jgi:hypothetical protein
MLSHVGSPINAMVGAMAVGTFVANIGENQRQLAHEEVLAELSNVTGMALCNALARSAQLRAELEKNRARIEEMRRIKEERMFREAERQRLQAQGAHAAMSEDQSNGRDATLAI